jgi:RAB protein geranylgeranyltransferase component A
MTIYRSDEKDFMREVEEMFGEEKQTDWKLLCGNLNKALVKEIEENNQLQTIVSYLEKKLGYDKV